MASLLQNLNGQRGSEGQYCMIVFSPVYDSCGVFHDMLCICVQYLLASCREH